MNPPASSRASKDGRSLILDRMVLFAAAFASVSLISLVLISIVGAFTPVVVVLVSLVPALAAGFIAARHHIQPTLRVPGIAPTAVLIVAVAVVAAFNVLYVSEHMATGRDPGVYLTIARWLSGHGDLLMEGKTGPFRGVEWVTADWTGYYETRSDGLLYAQFLHAFPSAIAALRWVFGDGALFYANTAIFVVGMSSVYLLVAQFVRDWIATLTVSIAAITVVAFYFARATYSEPLMLLLLVLGLIMFYVGLRSRSAFVMTIAGASIGATAMIRIDGWVLIGGFLVGAAILATMLRPEERWKGVRLFAVFSASVLVGSVGVIDGFLRSPDYIIDRRLQVAKMMILVAASAWLSAVIVAGSYRESPSHTRWKTWLEMHERRLRLVVGWVVIATAGALLFVRPLFFVGRGSSNPLIGPLLANEGQPNGAGRTLAELTLRWFTWYWGWVGVALVVVGLLAMLWSQNRRWNRTWFVIAVTGPLFALYLLRPSIAPDHPWAMRRFYATALILIPLLQAIAFEWITRSVNDSFGLSRTLRRLALIVVALVAVIVPVAVSAPLLRVGPQAGLRESVAEMCALLPERSAVIFHGDSINNLGAAVRSFCDVPTVASVSDLELLEVGALARGLAVDDDYVIVLITPTATIPTGWTIIGGETKDIPLAEVTFLRPSAGAMFVELSWFASTPPPTSAPDL